MIIPFSFLALMHFLGIFVGFYSLFLPKINALNKMLAFCGIVGAGFPLLITDIIIIIISANGTNRDLIPFITNVDTYSCLVFNFFIPQLIWAKLVQVFKGIAPPFYESCNFFLFVKVVVLTTISFTGLSLCALSEDNYLPLFCLAQSAYSICTCAAFVVVVYFKLKRMDMIFTPAPRRSNDSTSLSNKKVSDISIQSYTTTRKPKKV